MLLPLLLATSLASEPTPVARKWDDANPDIAVSALVPHTPEATFQYLLDLGHWRTIFPEDCIGRIEPGMRSFGEGASALVRYDFGMMHRKLAVTLVTASAYDRVDFDHLGSRGFVTRWRLASEAGGTRVTIETPLNPPPKPLRGYFYTVVQPEWVRCYEETLATLAKVAP
jgi:hypothetical protein